MLGRLLPALAAAALALTAALGAWTLSAADAPPGAGLLERLRAPFKVDASTDSLVLEDDPDARRYDRTRLLFESDEFVMVAVTRDDLFTPAGVAAVASLHAAFEAIDGVQSVLSLASVPLLRSFTAPLPLLRALQAQARVGDPRIDLAKAREELTGHALYAGNLVARDGRTAGIVVTLVATPESLAAARGWTERLAARAAARERLALVPLGDPGHAAARDALAAAEAEVARFRPEYVAAEDARKADRLRIVRRIRALVADARAGGADIAVSGVPSIVVEMVEAIQRDLEGFLGLSAAFVLGFLLLVFRRPRWIVLPLLATGATVVWTVALLLALGKRVTVITANIPSLLLVIGLAHAIHMIVRWRDLQVRHPGEPRGWRAERLVGGLWAPCLFTAATTVVGFLSLLTAGSRPIIDFGVLMAAGVAFSFVASLAIVPGCLAVLPDVADGRLERSAGLLAALARGVLRRRALVAGAALGLFAAGAWGASRLDVEARFIDYFRRGSPVHLGLTAIDERLGGTSGLEVIVTGPAGAFGPAHPENLERLAKVEAWLARRPEVGVVMGWSGVLDELRKSAPQTPARTVALQLGQLLSPALRQRLVGPYVLLAPVTVEGTTVGAYGATRIVARVRETDPGLRRGELLREVRAFLRETFPEGGEVQAEVTGMFVLYANMLASLMGSQVSSSAYCLGAIWLMLLVLFRHPGAATLALVPNLLPIVVVLGAMGAAGVPLDMATVMIASVSLGIGIDAAIHYLFVYRAEVGRDGDVAAALERTSASIGTSILWTALTSVVGFAVLAVSEFRPNAYFGLLTGVAMIAALFAMLTLLPVLIAAARLHAPRGSAPAGGPPTADPAAGGAEAAP